MRIAYSKNVDSLLEIGAEWAKEAKIGHFGFDFKLENAQADLERWLDTMPGVIIQAFEGEKMAGFFAVFAVNSFLGAQQVALEKYWYARPKSGAGLHLYLAAIRWARRNQCSHLIISASNIASGMHDKVARFCERMGMELFETAYIQEIHYGQLHQETVRTGAAESGTTPGEAPAADAGRSGLRDPVHAAPQDA